MENISSPVLSPVNLVVSDEDRSQPRVTQVHSFDALVPTKGGSGIASGASSSSETGPSSIDSATASVPDVPPVTEGPYICGICSNTTGPDEHQLCQLVCGHSFGLSCIKACLSPSTGVLGVCPVCKVPAEHCELRMIYGSSCRDEIIEEFMDYKKNWEKRQDTMYERLKEVTALNQALQEELNGFPPITVPPRPPS